MQAPPCLMLLGWSARINLQPSRQRLLSSEEIVESRYDSKSNVLVVLKALRVLALAKSNDIKENISYVLVQRFVQRHQTKTTN